MRLSPLISIVTGVSAATSYLVFAGYTLKTFAPMTQSVLFTPANHIAKAFFILICAGSAAFVAAQLKLRVMKVLEGARQKQELEDLFGEHVSHEVVQKLLTTKGGNLAETRKITALFLDIRNFTSFSESRSAHEVYTELNRLLEFMIEIVHENSGIVNKFLGDGFLAVFGAPLDDNRHALNAIKSAIEIQNVLEKRRANKTVADLDIGIGIHCGEALTGNVGSNKRKEYTVIGDVINLASRIEQLNKQTGTRILLSEEVRAEALGEYDFQDKGSVQVKGREQTVRIYTLA